MKTKTLLLLCYLLGTVSFQLAGQKAKTCPYVVPIEGNTYIISIVCDGIEVDKVSYPASYDLRERDHYNENIMKWTKGFVTNFQCTSILSGEVFMANDMEQICFETGLLTWHMNLNGNLGNHYNIRMVIDVATWTLLEYNSNCH